MEIEWGPIVTGQCLIILHPWTIDHNISLAELTRKSGSAPFKLDLILINQLMFRAGNLPAFFIPTWLIRALPLCIRWMPAFKHL